ncbi:MAG: gliding motility protein GldN [Sphingobacteriales bacterium JAD_PAG50586_3]|nr:MAG: gliding motility protein GldN [Sphingobacteriales bacterium JAD_PAG50586_3]
MRIKIALAVVPLLSIICSIQAQSVLDAPCPKTGNINNNVAIKSHIKRRTPMPYPQVREADIMWEKWVWRTIDMREKMNHGFYYPFEPSNNRANLLTVIKCGIANGLVTPYSSIDDEFLVPMTKEEALGIGYRTDTIQVPDLYDPDILRDTVIASTLNPKDVLEYRLKEIWFFDRQRSVMEVRIIGICPVRIVVDPATGEIKGKQEMYWIYFPQLRDAMVNYKAFNRFNNTDILSYDDIFMKRMFSSYVYKESNPFDRKITDYSTGMDAMIESQRVKTDIMDFEHDLWDW